MAFTGGCACGAVRFKSAEPPHWSAYCHCADCRAATGAPVALWAGFSAATTTWTGTLREWDSSEGVARGWCEACGAPLTYRDAALADGSVYIAVAALDDPAAAPPQAHAFWASRLSIFAIADDLPKYETTTRRRPGRPEPRRLG